MQAIALAQTAPDTPVTFETKDHLRRASDLRAGPSAPQLKFCCYVGERSALSDSDQRSLETKHHRPRCKWRIFGESAGISVHDFHRSNAQRCKCALSVVDGLLKACESRMEKPSACTMRGAHCLPQFHFGVSVPRGGKISVRRDALCAMRHHSLRALTRARWIAHYAKREAISCSGCCRLSVVCLWREPRSNGACRRP